MLHSIGEKILGVSIGTEILLFSVSTQGDRWLNMRLILEPLWKPFLPLMPDSWLWKPFICPDIYPEKHRDTVLQDLHRSVRSCNKGTMLFIFWEGFLVSYMLPFLWINDIQNKKQNQKTIKLFFFLQNLEEWLSGKELLFILQKTQIWLFASTWWFTTVYNTTSSRGFHTFFWCSWASSTYIVH